MKMHAKVAGRKPPKVPSAMKATTPPTMHKAPRTSGAAVVSSPSAFDLAEVKALLSNAPGVVVVDDPANQQYPMPKDAHDKDDVFVGRLRRDETQPKTLNMWVVSDNLRKGAATNAVQIAEYLLKQHLI